MPLHRLPQDERIVTFAVWPRTAFSVSGKLSTYHGRSFCPACGSRLFCLSEGKAELMAGTLDQAPTDLRPDYEIWTPRREKWLHEIVGAGQYSEDRPRQ